jgi:hypothetical protein
MPAPPNSSGITAPTYPFSATTFHRLGSWDLPASSTARQDESGDSLARRSRADFCTNFWSSENSKFIGGLL